MHDTKLFIVQIASLTPGLCMLVPAVRAAPRAVRCAPERCAALYAPRRVTFAGARQAPHRVASLSMTAICASAWQHAPAPARTASDLAAQKTERRPIVCVTAYDYPTGLALRGADVDICLVGDSLANVALGYDSTRPLTLRDSIHHARAVQRAVQSPELAASEQCGRPPLVVVDMPFGACIPSLEEAVRNVLRVVQETGAGAVKIEGSAELVPLVERLACAGVAVMGHIGLQPQRIASASSMRALGTSAATALEIWHTARALERAGCFSLVLECIPAKLAEFISERLKIPTIGIGAGPHTDGQVLVCTDIQQDLTSPAHVQAVLESAQATRSSPTGATLGSAPAEWPPKPKFVRAFAAPLSLGALRIHAIQRFAQAVRERTFPEHPAEAYRIATDEWRAFLRQAEAPEASQS